MNGNRLPELVLITLLAGVLARTSVAGAESVTVTGQSAISEREAVNDALRTAVERVGKVEIASWSTVENYELVQDVIKTRVKGLVTKHKVLSSEQGADKVWTVSVRAEVSPDALNATWADVEHLMDQLGEPTIMLFFDDMKQLVGWPDPKPFDRQSPVTTHLVKVLTDSGFRVIHRARHEFLKSKNMLDAKNEERYALYKAEDTFGADIYIDGTAIAEGPMLLERSGLYRWQTTARCTAYWSDSGMVMFSTDLKISKKNFSDPSEANAIKLLDHTADLIGQQVKSKLMQRLARRAVEGGIITIKIDNAEVEQQFTVEDFLKEFEGVRSVRLIKRYDTAVILEIKTKLLLPSLERKLLRSKFDGFRLGVPHTQGRTVVFKLKPVKPTPDAKPTSGG